MSNNSNSNWTLEPNCGDKLNTNSASPNILLTYPCNSRRGSPVNALWTPNSGAVLSSEHPHPRVYKFTVNELSTSKGGSMFVGMCSEDRFQSGWKLKCFSYGGPGNLSDGTGLKRSGYGPVLKGALTVYMFAAIVAGDVLQIRFALGSQGLGVAFEIEHASSLGKLLPCISFHECKPETALSVEISEENGDLNIPSFDVGGNDVMVQRATICGSWNLMNVNICIDQNYTINAKVANSFTVNISPTFPHASMGQLISTRMMAPPHMEELEQNICNILKTIQRLELNDSGSLVIHFGEGQREIAEPVTNTSTIQPVNRREISWLR